MRATGASSNSIVDNTISGNDLYGVLLAFAGTVDNSVTDNKIGTNSAGSAAIPNTGDGVRIVQGANRNRVQSNTVSGNGARAVAIDGATTALNDISDNIIGTDSHLGSTLHNGTADAVRITAPNNIIGSNSISAATTGILVFRPHATGNSITDNIIGGSLPLGMTEGIRLIGGAANTQVSSNQISHNATGVVVSGTGQGNLILDNRIFSNSVIGIDLGGDNVTANDDNDADTGPNRLQNTLVFFLGHTPNQWRFDNHLPG